MSKEAYTKHLEDHARSYYADSMHAQILDMIITDIFVMIEDDYLPVPDSIPRLFEILERNPDCVIASAVQTYRCPTITKIGIAPVEDIIWDHEKIIKKTCLSPRTQGIVEAKGTSFSCFAAKTGPYREAWAHCKAKNLLMTYIGHDMVITNTISKIFGKVLVDFDLWGQHMQLINDGIYYYGRKDAVQDCYTWNDQEYMYNVRMVN